jgi:diguanylate cyclase (GGDEF)-like protein
VGGVHFVDRLRVAVSEFEFEGRESQPGGRVTVSAGVAAFPHDADSLESLIAAADQMLYEAKRAGRNRVCSRFSAPTSQAKQKTA